MGRDEDDGTGGLWPKNETTSRQGRSSARGREPVRLGNYEDQQVRHGTNDATVRPRWQPPSGEVLPRRRRWAVLTDRINTPQRIISLARPLLEPREVVAHVVRAMEGPNRLIGGLIAMAIGVGVGIVTKVPFLGFPLMASIYLSIYPRRILLATDQALVLIQGGRWRWTPKKVIERFDVDTPIGPLQGFFLYSRLGDRRLWIVPRCIPEVKAADRDLDG